MTAPARRKNAWMTWLVILLLAPLTVGQTSTSLDVVDIKIIGQPSWTFGEPADAALEVTVRNGGGRHSEPYVLRFAWLQGSQSRPLNEDDERSLDAGASLGPGATRVHHVPWRLQDGQHPQVGEGSIVVRMQAAADVVRMKTTFIPSHDFTVATSDAAIQIGPDATGLYPITVTNVGNIAETMRFTIRTDHPRMEASLSSPTLEVPAGQVGQTRLLLHFPFDNDVTGFDTTFEVAAESTGLPGIVHTVTTGTAAIRPGAAVAERLTLLEPVNQQTVYVAPGASADVVFTLHNKGETSEGYTISATAQAWHEPGLRKGTRIGLLPDEKVMLHAHATAPDAAPGSPGTIGILVVTDAGVPIERTVPVRLHGSAPSPGSLTLPGPGPYVGEDVEVRAQIMNHGDVEAKNITVRVDLTYATGSASTTETIASLGPGKSIGISATLAAPTHAGKGEANVRVQEDPAAVVLRSGFTVQEPSIAVVAPQPLHGYPGEAVRYHAPPHVFVVRNDGSESQELVLTSGATGAAAVAGSAQFMLGPGESRWVPVTHTLPAKADQDAYGLILRAALAAAPHRFTEATVETEIKDDAPPIVAWIGQAPGAVGVGADYPVLVSVEDVSPLASAWAVVHPTKAVVALDADTLVGHVPLGAAGEYTIQVFAEDVHGNIGSSSNRTVTVVAATPPTIDDVEVDVKMRNVTLRARIDGVGAVVTVSAGAGPLMVPVINGWIRHTFHLAPGNHTLAIMVTDSNGLQASAEKTVQVAAAEVPVDRVAKEAGAGWWVVAALLWSAWRQRLGRVSRA